jgi:hypothetical protein
LRVLNQTACFINIKIYFTNVYGMPPFNGAMPGTRSYDGTYMASNVIQAGNNVVVQSTTKVEFFASEVILSAGFTAENGSVFSAVISPCLAACDNGVGKDPNKGSEPEFGITMNYEKYEYSIDSEFDEIFEREINVFPNPSSDGLFEFVFVEEHPRESEYQPF